MALTFTNDDIKVLAQEALNALIAEIPAASTMGTLLTATGTLSQGDTVKVPVYTAGADAAVWNATTNNYGTLSDDDVKFKDVVLDQRYNRGFGIDDIKRLKVNELELARINGQKIGKAMMVNVLTKVTATNFAQVAHTGIASAFNLDDVVDIWEKTESLNFGSNRWLVLPPSYLAELMKDGVLQTTESSVGLGNVLNAQLPQLSGMNIIMNKIIPNNSQNLVGYVTDGSGLAIATDVIRPSQRAIERGELEYVEVVHEGSGLTIGVRHFYDNLKGVDVTNFSILFGSAIGQANGLARVRSAE